MSLCLHRRGRVEYAACLGEMQSFTDQRGADTADALWLVEHPPVFTVDAANGQGWLLEHLTGQTAVA